MSPTLERVRVPETFPHERVVLGDLHLLRVRLDEMLVEVAQVIERGAPVDEGWLRVEEAGRLARRLQALMATARIASNLIVGMLLAIVWGGGFGFVANRLGFDIESSLLYG